ncbi:MAG: glycerate kinase [Phycisphaerae bacterium]|nr:glycerate kinase [Phycisphaerae bacterium]
MKIVIAPDSFKGSITAAQACKFISEGVLRVLPDAQVVSIPMADGGEGTVEAMVGSVGGQLREVEVTGPMEEKVTATYGILEGQEGATGCDARTAVMEMAEAAGLPLVPADQRNPLYTTTYGLGELIRDAFDQGIRKFIIGIGGSATNDCGTGMAQGLGVGFFDRENKCITRPLTANIMAQVTSIDVSRLEPIVRDCRFTVACDVTNPLLGPNGASFTYGPQKGADEFSVKFLEANMAHIIGPIEEATGRVVRDIPGAGGAGGLGAGLMAFLNASLEPGIKIIMDFLQFDQKIKDADLLITAEGLIDATSAAGKTLSGVAQRARAQNIPVIALAGAIQDRQASFKKLQKEGVSAIFSIAPGPITLDESLQITPELLADTAEQVVRSFLMRAL